MKPCVQKGAAGKLIHSNAIPRRSFIQVHVLILEENGSFTRFDSYINHQFAFILRGSEVFWLFFFYLFIVSILLKLAF